MTRAIDVLAIGHAIVDVVAVSDDPMITQLGLEKGTMTLVDSARAEMLWKLAGDVPVTSGGSAANTAAGIASLGGNAHFIGKVGDDEAGRLFTKDIRSVGVEFEVVPADGMRTSTCVVFVTPDAQRTMNTSLGAGSSLSASDIDESLMAQSQVVYVEGYMCVSPEAAELLGEVLNQARRASCMPALSLSDPAWVQLHRAELLSLLPSDGIVFGNGDEAMVLSGEDTVEGAMRWLERHCAIPVVTLGAKGCLVSDGFEILQVPPTPVEEVLDTTGAGDLFAAGYLFGHCRGYEALESARIGVLAAAEVISHLGARPLVSLSGLVALGGEVPELEVG